MTRKGCEESQPVSQPTCHPASQRDCFVLGGRSKKRNALGLNTGKVERSVYVLKT